MRSTPFNPDTDLEPIPFDEECLRAAREMKLCGLKWTPHVGCFVWDEKGVIQVSSPFPNRVYFILNMGHFLKIFGSLEGMQEQLTWVPTWHQARLLCRRVGVEKEAVRNTLDPRGGAENQGKELLSLYRLIAERLRGA